MQAISFSDLKKLKDNSIVVEDESTGIFSYDEFIKIHHNLLKLSNNDIYIAYEKLKNKDKSVENSGWLAAKCPPIKLVGTGSSRTAFCLLGSKCLKVAINKRGSAQNKQEISNINRQTDAYDCFPHVYAFDKSKYLSLLTECCTIINH